MPQEGRMIPTQKLQEKTARSVNQNISHGRFSMKPLFAIHPEKQRASGHIERGRVDLDGMDGIREKRILDGPRKMRFFSVAAAVEKASHPPEAMGQKNVGGQKVRHLKIGPFLARRIKTEKDERPQGAAVENDASLPDGKNFHGTVRVIIPVLDDVENAGPRETRQSEIEDEIQNLAGLKTHPDTVPSHQKRRGQNTQSYQETIGVHGEWTDMKQDRYHATSLLPREVMRKSTTPVVIKESATLKTGQTLKSRKSIT